MIRTATQLKAKVRNLSGGDSTKAQTLIRVFLMMILKRAFLATSSKRNTTELIPDFRNILMTVESDDAMRRQWENYRKESFFIGELTWNEVMESVKRLVDSIQ